MGGSSRGGVDWWVEPSKGVVEVATELEGDLVSKRELGRAKKNL